MLNVKRNTWFSVFQKLSFIFVRIWKQTKEEKTKTNQKEHTTMFQVKLYHLWCLCWQRGRNMASVNSVIPVAIWLNIKKEKQKKKRKKFQFCKDLLSSSVITELVSKYFTRHNFFFNFSSFFSWIHYFSTGNKCQIC